MIEIRIGVIMCLWLLITSKGADEVILLAGSQSPSRTRTSKKL